MKLLKVILIICFRPLKLVQLVRKVVIKLRIFSRLSIRTHKIKLLNLNNQ
jgi:hypothetical protein